MQDWGYKDVLSTEITGGFTIRDMHDALAPLTYRKGVRRSSQTCMSPFFINQWQDPSIIEYIAVYFNYTSS